MESEIVESLNDIGYTGPLTNEEALVKALEGGPKSLAYTKLVHILAEELKQLCGLEETVNIINDVDDSSSFLLELSSFLKELGCPYKKLVTGHMSSRLQSKEDRLILLDYMLSELMAARMLNIDKPKDTSMKIVKHESNTARDLKNILISLKFNKPPPTITAEMLFNKLTIKLQETIQKEGDGLVGKPLYNKAMNEKQWKDLEVLFTEMLEEYRLRRETLITRLECTIQSFEWSDRLKGKKELIQESYRPKREQMKFKPDISLSDFLAARTSLLHVEKTSSANVRRNTTSDVNKVIIGRVPDRGGRPNEQQPPPPEMPSWQQQRTQESVIIHDSESEPDCDQVEHVESISSEEPKSLQSTPSTTKKKKSNSQKRRDKKRLKQQALEKETQDLKRGLDENIQKEDDVNCKRLRTEELSIETLTGINLAIVTDNYPTVKLKQDDYIELRELLFTLLEEKEPCPDIHINRAAGGFVVVICTDLYSAKWLLDLNHIKLKSLTLKVIEMDDLPRPVKMAWRSVYTGQIELKRILGLIQKLNPTVHTELWRVVDTLTEGLNVIRIILVDLESAEVIRGKGFCLKAGLEGNFFKILEEPEANKDTLIKELTFIDLEQDDLIKKSAAVENGLTVS